MKNTRGRIYTSIHTIRLHQSFPRFQPPADLTGSPGTAEDKVGTVLGAGVWKGLSFLVWVVVGTEGTRFRCSERCSGRTGSEIPVDGRLWLAV